MENDEVLKQSKNAYAQWCETWRAHAIENGKLEQRPFKDIEGIGVGSAAILVANGYSFEEDIEVLKESKDDIYACDKTLGALLDHGITPKGCIVCDAVVDYEKYLEPWKDKIGGVDLYMNICGNPKWAKAGWKNKFFFANQDVLQSEKEFMELSGCPNMIPAATNVSNAMVVLLFQSDNSGRKNVFGYDKVLLTGFDYCWHPTGNYYAFDHSAGGKRDYMRHIFLTDNSGQFCYTSNNLHFSSRWLSKYINTYNLPVVQCSNRSLLGLKYTGKLKDQINYNYNRQDSSKLIKLKKEKKEISQRLKELRKELNKVELDHYKNLIATV